jgi:DNA polymerase III subunit gamma/tau
MTVLYRKYRPQKISELDSLDIQKKLHQILSSDEIPHAFLFSGPRGLGKTSSARIIAKSVNCLNNKGKGEPCNECDMCLSISNGTNVDVMEIDAASNRGIDDIRDLREKIRLAPTRARYKVYIIDEVHMLTTEAFNALLKTLEEPPSYTVFILCTTEPGKLPETIISRCIRFDFQRATEKEILTSLKRAIIGEKLEVGEDAFLLLAKLADGSFRDAHKSLEQLRLVAKKITKEIIEETFGLNKEGSDKSFLLFLAKKDSRKALLWIEEHVKNGLDIRLFHDSLLSLLRAYLLKKASNIEIQPDMVWGEDFELFSISELEKLIEMISLATIELKTAVIPQLPIELVVIKWCENNKDNKSASVIVHEIQYNPPQNEEEKSSVKHIEKNLNDLKVKDGQNDDVFENSIDDPVPLTDIEAVMEKWDDVLRAVKPMNHSVEALLKGCRPLGMDGKFLVIQAFYKFHKEKLEEQKARSILEKALKDIFGQTIVVKCVLGEKSQKISAPVVYEPEDEVITEAAKIFGVTK